MLSFLFILFVEDVTVASGALLLTLFCAPAGCYHPAYQSDERTPFLFGEEDKGEGVFSMRCQNPVLTPSLLLLDKSIEKL
jgi:hypothetical protein